MKIFGISHKRWERANFITGPCYKTFEQIQASSPTKYALLFLKLQKFLPRSNGKLTEQPLASSVPTKCTHNDENQTPNPHHSVRGVY